MEKSTIVGENGKQLRRRHADAVIPDVVPLSTSLLLGPDRHLVPQEYCTGSLGSPFFLVYHSPLLTQT